MYIYMMCDDGYTLVINFMFLSTKNFDVYKCMYEMKYLNYMLLCQKTNQYQYEVFKLHVAMLEDQPISIYLNNNNKIINR